MIMIHHQMKRKATLKILTKQWLYTCTKIYCAIFCSINIVKISNLQRIAKEQEGASIQEGEINMKKYQSYRMRLSQLFTHTGDKIRKQFYRGRSSFKLESVSADKKTATDSNIQLHTFATHPFEQLSVTVRSIISQDNLCLNPNELLRLESEIELELNQSHPFPTLEHFDFCIICSYENYGEANNLKNRLCEKYNVTGHIIWDSVGLGMDLFYVFEDVISRCTKIIFYITANFVEDEFCCHLARNTFIVPGMPNTTMRMKVVPIISNTTLEIPDCLTLIEKLDLDKPEQFEFRMSGIFSEVVKQERINRKYESEKEIDNARKALISDLIKVKL